MKDEETAISLGNRGASQNKPNKTRIVAYGVIGLLILFILFVQNTDTLPDFDIEKVASITSWSVGTSSDPLGYFRKEKTPDLRVSILAIGAVDAMGVLRENDTLISSGVAGIRLEVENIGDATSESWTFNILLPTKEGYEYTSPPQDKMDENESKRFLFTFDKLSPSDAADITASISSPTDTNETNNSDTKIIEIF